MRPDARKKGDQTRPDARKILSRAVDILMALREDILQLVQSGHLSADWDDSTAQLRFRRNKKTRSRP